MSAAAPVTSIEIGTLGLQGLRDRISLAAEQAKALDRGPVWARLVAQLSTYLASVIERSLMEYGDIPERKTAMVRGVEWRGWKAWTRRAYGGTVTESTRYYLRKEARKGTSLDKRASGRTWSREQRKANMKISRRDRPLELVWKKRASGQRYSQNAKLMQDTGEMRKRLYIMDVRIVGDTVELRPGPGQMHYFARQNEMRPMWHADRDPRDAVAITAMVQKAWNEIMRIIETGVVS